ncbi:MAG: alpha/beta fold hydrolase, partial [Bacteroidota bacterium]
FPSEGKTTARTVKSYTIEQFYENTNIGGGSFSPDGSKLLCSSNATGIYNAVALPVDGSAPIALTSSDKESIFASSYFPNDERFLFSSDQGGNENSHVYVQDLDGTVTDLTPDEGSRAGFAGWSRNLDKFFMTWNKRDARFMDFYSMDLENFEAQLIYQNDEGFDVGALSDDEQYMVLTKTITTTNNNMYLLDLKTGEKQLISEHEGDATFNPQFFSRDNQFLYYLTDLDNEFTYLAKYNLETGESIKEWGTDWDVWYAYNSWNNKYRVIGVNEDAKTKLYLFDNETGEQIDLPSTGNKEVTSVSISRDETKMRVTLAGSTSPNNIGVVDLKDLSFKQLTNTLNPEIDEADLVTAEVVRFKSYDGLEVPAIYYKPHQASKDNKVPALVWVHGGPGGQSRTGYFALIQYLANSGYAVFAVNNRGSSGYGKTFYKMDDQKHGDVDLKDCIAAKEYLQTLDYIDGEKIGIIGGSYGGYMTMAALTFTPDEFAVGVNIFGVTNWLRTLNSIPPYWESFREALYAEMGDPTTADSTRLYNISPLFHAENVTKPLMVLQGANDPRVLQVESDEIVEAVKKNGVPVEYVLFPDEGHGFVKKENEIKGYGDIRVFLDKYLKQQEDIKN